MSDHPSIQAMLQAYQRAFNAIDDLMEYRGMDKAQFTVIAKRLTEQLKSLGDVAGAEKSFSPSPAFKDDNLASPATNPDEAACGRKVGHGDEGENPSRRGESSEISVIDDFRDKISNALECANLFVLKHCDKPKAVEVIQAINAGRDALRLHKPVSVDLEDMSAVLYHGKQSGRSKIHGWVLLSENAKREYRNAAKAVLEAAGVPYEA